MNKLNKTILNIIILSCILIIPPFLSCEKDFLEKPRGSDINVDSIFADRERALSAIAQAYGNSLGAGIQVQPWDNNLQWTGMNAGTLSHISGELNSYKFSWEHHYTLQRAGMNSDGGGNGRAMSIDGYDFNYTSIRRCFLIIENIDKVGDISQEEKDQIKAEMKTLIAYRYQEMFKRYGGVSLIKKSLTAEEEILIPRSNLQEVLDYIIELCDEAVVDLPNLHPDNMKGRVTKGVALAVKAEALIYAARPLFNSTTPYLDLGEYNNLICFGNIDPNRWQNAIKASEEVITWALANGHQIINTGNPLEDYGTAVATPNNREILLAYKRVDQTVDDSSYDPRRQAGGANGMSFYQLKQYYKEDGTDLDWPKPDGTTYPYAHYRERINQIEARYKASAAGAGIDAWNNPGDSRWNSETLAGGSNWNGQAQTEACGRRTKFWYRASNRNWFEFPIYRLAEFYLNLAEAYNELDNSSKALENLNVIRTRAGLPKVTETNRDRLRKIIQREWAVEFYEEGHRVFDVKHWKHEDIANGIIGGPKFTLWYHYISGRTWARWDSEYTNYEVRQIYVGAFSAKEYLCPFPIKEVNKGYLVQNPGY